MIKDRLGARPAVLYLPIGIEGGFKGLVDLVENRAIIWLDESLGAKFEYQEIPADLADAAATARQDLIEMAVEQDDEVMEHYLEGTEPDTATLKKLIRKGTLNFSFVPVLCGSAFKNKGVQPLLDAVVDYLPSPLDIPPVEGLKMDGDTTDTRAPSDDAPFSALAFKIMNDPFVGTLTFARIYSGKLETASQVTNSVKDKKEKVGRMLLMHANDREDIQVAYAGDIVALAGLKDTTTGDTLCAANAPIILERMEFPDPVIEVAVEPKTKADQEKMGVALNRLAREDPSFRVTTDHEMGQTIIKGMGELHLEILVDRMKREFKVEANVGAPQVAYREYLAKPVDLTYTHKKQSGGSGQFGEIKISVDPGRARLGLRLHRRDQGRQRPEGIYPVGREGHARDRRDRFADRLPDHRLRGPPDRRQVSRRRLVGAGVRNLCPRRDARSGPEGGHQAARADHEGRGRDPRGLSRRRHRRLELAARPDPGHRHPGQCPGGRGDGAAGQHVRLCEPAALVHPGPGPILDAVLAL